MMRIISLGAGVQSTTMALMAAHGEIGPMPDCAIFADTQAEPQAVYDHLKWLMSPNVLPFPVHIVTAGNLERDIGSSNEKRQWSKTIIPAFAKGDDGRASPISRQCTRDYKIIPIEREVRRQLGLTGKRAPKYPVVEQWIGISLDEAIRMKPPRHAWQHHRWPLIEKRMNRHDCLLWLERHDYSRPPRSACVFCPYRSNHEWRSLPPDDFDRAVAIDQRLRSKLDKPLNQKSKFYLHRDMVPLEQVDLRTDEKMGQLNLFNNECEGMCGV